MKPGDLGYYDREFANRHHRWLQTTFDRYFRTRVEGLETVPDGPFLSVGNHNGSVMMPDLFVWGTHYHGLGRRTPMLAMSHDLLFTLPPARLSRALAKIGALRATRENALAALEQGFAVHAYPGGDFDATKSFRDRHKINFAGRLGYARVAFETGVPLVPVVSVGAHEILFILTDGSKISRALGLDRRARMPVLPIMFCLPWGMWVGIPPGFIPLPSQISLRVLPALQPSDYASPEELDRDVRERMQTALTGMARGRIPVLGRMGSLTELARKRIPLFGRPG